VIWIKQIQNYNCNSNVELFFSQSRFSQPICLQQRNKADPHSLS